ncbi:MAG: hypothetical protein ABW128_19205 [Rhizorhabdus sp.]
MRIEVILDEGTHNASSTSTGTRRTAALVFHVRERLMEDLLWILVMVGLVAATLAYARLCDNA